MAPMTRSQSPGGVPTKEVADYYRRRAAAEVGLIISEGTGVARPASLNDPNIPRFHGEAELAGWKTVIDAVHAAGGLMAPAAVARRRGAHRATPTGRRRAPTTAPRASPAPATSSARR